MTRDQQSIDAAKERLGKQPDATYCTFEQRVNASMTASCTADAVADSPFCAEHNPVMPWHLKTGKRGATGCGLTLMFGLDNIDRVTCQDCRDAYYAGRTGR